MEPVKKNFGVVQALMVLFFGAALPVAVFLLIVGDISQFVRFFEGGGYFMWPVVGLYALSILGMAAASLWGWYNRPVSRKALFLFVALCALLCCVVGWLGAQAGIAEAAQALGAADWDQRDKLGARYASIAMIPMIFGWMVAGVLCLFAGGWSCGWGVERRRLESLGVGLGGMIALIGLVGAFVLAGGNASDVLGAVPLGVWLVFCGGYGVGILALGCGGDPSKSGEAREEEEPAGAWGAWFGAMLAPCLVGYGLIWLHLGEILRVFDLATQDRKVQLLARFSASAERAWSASVVVLAGMLLLGGAMLALRGEWFKGRGHLVLCALLLLGGVLGISWDVERRVQAYLNHARGVSVMLRAPSLRLLSDPHAPSLLSLPSEVVQISADGKRKTVRLPMKKQSAPSASFPTSDTKSGILSLLGKSSVAGTKRYRVILQTDRRATLRVVLAALRSLAGEQVKKKRILEADWVVQREESSVKMSDFPKYPPHLHKILKPLMWAEIGGYRLQFSTAAETEKMVNQRPPLLLTLRIRPNGVTITSRGKAIGAGCDLREGTNVFPTCGRKHGGWDKACIFACMKKIKDVFPEENKLRVHVAESEAIEVSLLSVFDAVSATLRQQGVMDGLFPEITWVLDKTLSWPSPTRRIPIPVGPLVPESSEPVDPDDPDLRPTSVPSPTSAPRPTSAPSPIRTP